MLSVNDWFPADVLSKAEGPPQAARRANDMASSVDKNFVFTSMSSSSFCWDAMLRKPAFIAQRCIRLLSGLTPADGCVLPLILSLFLEAPLFD